MINFVKYVIGYQEFIGFVAAALGAISFLPQIVKIFKSRSVKDISFLMYIIYGISVLLWLVYGIIIGSPPLIVTEILKFTLVLTIIIMKHLWKQP